MKFTRTKQIIFTNNKWWVWKTTLAYNIGKFFAKKWYKTVLIDLDPQCNLSRLALGEEFMQKNLFSDNNVYKVLENVINGRWDVDFSIKFTDLWENFSILQWNISLSMFESILSNSFNEAASWQSRWFFVTSAIDRFLKKKWLHEEVDLFIIDTNPSLSQLNKSIFLGTDYFLVPMMPDAFNHQWIENIGSFFEQEKRNWNVTAKVLARENNILSSEVLNWDPLFLGYIINSYNVYAKKPIKTHNEWIEKLPKQVKKFLSFKHCKNWLVDISWQKELGFTQDYWQLAGLAQEKSKAIFEFNTSEIWEIWTKEILEKAQKEFNIIYENILERINMW